VAQFNADILFNADVRKALKGIDKLEGGIRSVVFEVEKFEAAFKRVAQGSASKFQLEQQRKLAGAISEQNKALAEQVTLASQLGNAYDNAARRASEFSRVVRSIAEVRQQALPGTNPVTQRALPARTSGKPIALQREQDAAIAAEAKLRKEIAEEAARQLRVDKAITEAKVKLERAAEGEVSSAVRSGQKIVSKGTGNTQPFLQQPRTTSSKYQQRVQQEVDRQLRVNGKLTKEIQETVNSYNKLQAKNRNLIKTTGRLVTAQDDIVKEAKKDAKKSKKKGGRRGLGASIGFPLLFGGGAGSIAGGVIGSLVGDFDEAILGSGLGSQVDAFGAKLTNLSGALEGAGGSTQALEALIGDLDTETARRIENLEKSGQTALAADAAFEKLSEEIGRDLAKAAVIAGQDLDTLGTQITKFFTILGVSIASLIQEALFLNIRNPLEDIPEVGPETAVERTTSGEAVELARTELELAEARLAKDDEAALAIERKLIKQRKANELSEVTRQIQDNTLDAQIGENKQREIELRAKRDLADLDAKAATAAERKEKAAERAAERAKREAEAAQRKADAAARKARQNEAALLAEQNKLYAVDTKITQATEGRAAAIVQELENLEAAYNIDAQRIILATEDRALAQAKVNTLAKEYELKEILLRQEYASIQQQKEILKLKQQQALAGISTDIGRQIEDANFRGTGNAAQDEQLQLRIDQTRRAEDVTTRLNNALAEQQKIIDNPANADQAMRAEETRQNLQNQLDLYNQLLPQLNQAEQAQLRYNQVLEAAQPYAEAFATGLTQGLRDVVAGTKTAEEAFADFLNNIADLLIQTAATMIAQYIAIGIARAFAGIPGGSSGSDFSQFGSNTTGVPTNFIGSGLTGFNRAAGGPTAKGSPYIVGENGTELFIPNVSGRIVPADDFEAARAAMGGGGGSDSSSVDGAFEASSSSVSSVRERLIQNDMKATSAKYSSDPITFETIQIGSMDVVTREEAEAIGQASAQQARAQVFGDLRNKPAARRQVGLR